MAQGETGLGGLRRDPVILLGMHHSGTSIFAEVLDRHGVFMDATMRHHESKLFTRRINNEMIMGGGANWARDPIMPVADVLAMTDRVQGLLQAKGLKKLLRDGYDGQAPWGWKDPRTCVTLPLFLRIFPDARLLHIVRREEDVAESLASRPKKDIGRVENREFWRSLHRQHVARVREFAAGKPNFREFSYEEFCFQPVEVTRPLFDFLGIDFPDEARAFLEERVYKHRVGIAGDREPPPQAQPF